MTSHSTVSVFNPQFVQFAAARGFTTGSFRHGKHGAAVHGFIGSILADQFRIDRLLGAGGMGVVFAELDLVLNRDVAER